MSEPAPTPSGSPALDIRYIGRLLLIYGVVGIASGLAAVCFDWLVQWISAAIDRGGLLVGVPGDRPTQVLNQLVHRARLPAECDRTRILSLLIDREELSSTGVGDSIALPHPHTDALQGIDEPGIIIALLSHPVDWEAFDGLPVDTVCVLLCGSGDVHLQLLGDLARSLMGPDVRLLLRRRAGIKQVLAEVGRLLES